jgi:hypothetical protein
MTITGSRSLVTSAKPVSAAGWTPAIEPTVMEMLDHLSRELAQEYVTFMEAAAERERGPVDPQVP